MFAPGMDAFLLHGLLFLDLRTTMLLWSGFLGAQLVTAAHAFRLDRLRP